MERTEFIRGWILLTTQPWGKAYRSTTQTSVIGEPNPAEVQAELYYKSLQYSYPPAWIEACECLAQGDHWPSISECKETLKHAKAQPPQRKALAAPDRGPFLTQEEFGIDLFNAIKTNAARLQALKQGQDKRAKELNDELQSILPKIQNPDDIRRILAMQ